MLTNYKKKLDTGNYKKVELRAMEYELRTNKMNITAEKALEILGKLGVE